MPHGFGEGFKNIVKQGAGEVWNGTRTVLGKGTSKARDAAKGYVNNIREERAANSLFRGKAAEGLMRDRVRSTGIGKAIDSRAANLLDDSVKGAKGLMFSAALAPIMYGISALATDPGGAVSPGDRMHHYNKHMVAAGVDVASDVAMTGVAIGLAQFGPYGQIAAGALTAYNVVSGFVGWDLGTLSMNFMDAADQEYESRKQGPKFNMTQNTSMAMQRQMQNLHASGSNIAEMMHN